jgi:formylglycine-generating enzyme required for sulfatase activity
MKRRGKRIALLAGAGALAVAVVAGLYWEKLAAWVRFVSLFEHLGRNEQGYSEYRHRQTEMVMVRVPGGTFMMGTTDKEEVYVLEEVAKNWGSAAPRRAKEIVSAEQPCHRVSLSPFFIAKFEVTQAVWKRIMGTDYSTRFTGDDLPMDSLSWKDCVGFCAKTGLSLPTEAQWEYACRLGTETPYSGGSVDDLGWHQNNSGFKVHPVGQKKPNAFGLFDMHGNAVELVLDSFDAEF